MDRAVVSVMCGNLCQSVDMHAGVCLMMDGVVVSVNMHATVCLMVYFSQYRATDTATHSTVTDTTHSTQ